MSTSNSKTYLSAITETTLDSVVGPVYITGMAKKTDISDRTTLRWGSLLRPLKRRISQTGETVSAYVRRLVANDLGRPEPKFDGSGKGLKKYNRERKRKARK